MILELFKIPLIMAAVAAISYFVLWLDPMRKSSEKEINRVYEKIKSN